MVKILAKNSNQAIQQPFSILSVKTTKSILNNLKILVELTKMLAKIAENLYKNNGNWSTLHKTLNFDKSP